jgi:O-antigen/teichoic acid export membrane protein
VILRSIFNRLNFSDYQSNFLYILSSKVLIAFFAFITTPIIARLFSPKDYGLFALMSTITLTLTFLTNLSLPLSLLVIKEDKIESTVAGTLTYAILSNCFFLAVGLFFMYLFNESLLNSDFSFGLQVCLLISMGSFLLTVNQILANLNIREKAFKTNVAVNLTEHFSLRVIGLSMGILGLTKLGLFWADLTGKIFNTLSQFFFRKSEFILVRINSIFSIHAMRATIRENKQYPLYHVPFSILSNFSTQIVLWLLAIFFSTPAVGYFTM